MSIIAAVLADNSAVPIEDTIVWIVQWAKLGIETIGATLVAIGVLVAIIQLLRQLAEREATEFTAIRLVLARYLALALEFELGADILSTAIAPSWQQIGKLGAIAIIRTGLNYFLSKEMESERRVREAERQVA